jgi:ectoine hydroxylase-related dioxygenase (phytanoyl-CoA dioxygenase family)
MIVAAETWTLSETQRLHLDVYGYVVVPSLLDPAEATEIREVLFDIEARFRRDGGLVDGVKAHFSTSAEYFRIDNLPHVHPCFHRYLTHPRILSAVEEMIGGAARVEQSDAHIRRPSSAKADNYGFHRGTYQGFGYTENDLYHFPFVKALTNLTDLGPDDGGTSVIAGSHKLHPRFNRAVIEAAMADPTMIRQVIAPAGSTLLFFESLLHSGGIIRSGRSRALIIGGYTPTQFQAWKGYDPDPAFLATLGDEERARYSGSERWSWRQRFRAIS